MSSSVVDQVLWATAGISTDDTPAVYTQGDTLPAASAAGDLAVRQVLRDCGVLRQVTVVTTEAEFTAAALAVATAADSVNPVLNITGEMPIVADISE